MRWMDDLLMEHMPIARCNLQLALYAAHLGAGCSIWCKQIKLAMIQKYINAVASFIGLFGTHPRDPRKANPADGSFAKLLVAVYQELGQYEEVPNRREPFTLKMLHHQQAATKDAPFLISPRLLPTGVSAAFSPAIGFQNGLSTMVLRCSSGPNWISSATLVHSVSET